MESGQIQLGAKKGFGKSSDQVPTQGFFYCGAACAKRKLERWDTDKLLRGFLTEDTGDAIESAGLNPAPVAPNFNFYDIPSQKRVARCTNILHKGARLSGLGEGQRLRKGFQGQWRGSLTICGVQQGTTFTQMSRLSYRCRPTACFESLSSAAETKAFSEKYEVMVDITLPWLHS